MQKPVRKLHKRPSEAPGIETTGYPPPLQQPYNIYNPPGGIPQNNAMPNYPPHLNAPQFTPSTSK